MIEAKEQDKKCVETLYEGVKEIYSQRQGIVIVYNKRGKHGNKV